MGKPAARLNDPQSGHSAFPPSPCNSSSSNVIINGKGVMRVGDTFVKHCATGGCHVPVLAKGSSTVIVNGKQMGRMGDSTACGGVVMIGSSNVIVGG